MILEELTSALEELFPDGFAIDTDRYGQIIIYTGMQYDENDGQELVAFDPDEDEDSDPDFDDVDGELDDD